MTESPLVDSSFVVPVFSLGDDPIACLNKAMDFLTVVSSSRVTVQQVQGRQGQSYSGTDYKSNATSSGGNTASGQARVVKCYNYQGEGHMARQCNWPKRPRNAVWYKDKAMLAEAQEAGQILDEEQLAFLADPGVPDCQAIQTIIPINAAFQTEDLDTYDSDCDDVSNAKAVLMANISNYGSDVISEVPHSETHLNDIENQGKANKEQNNESVTVELERYKERVKTFEQRLNIDLSSREKMINSQMDDMIKEKLALKEKVDSLKQNLYKQIKEKECYQNPFYLKKAQLIKPTWYDGIVISAKHVAMPVIDDEETLILEEECRSKMSKKEKDPEAIKQNISYIPIDYEKLNRLSDDFGKCFTLQQELSAEQAFWLRMSNPTSKPSYASPVKIEAPKELPKVSLVNESLKNLKFHLARFDNVVKIRTTPDARTEGMFKLDLEPLAPRLLQNREAHIDYLKYTQEQADILREIELLVNVRYTCPNTIKLNKKKVVVTPKNKVKKVRFTEPLTSSSNVKQVKSSKISYSNTPVLSPTGLKCSTSNCGSKPTGNKKNNKISRTTSKNMKNKVEAQPRKVNKKNRVVEPIRDVDVKHSLLNANSETICATCKKSMFDGVHDTCLLDFVENVNSHAKSAKKHKR
ncbi:hypothetical protein Tco_0493367 [Tanacetum coccineum]